MDEISKKKKRAIVLGLSFQFVLFAFLISSLAVLVVDTLLGFETRDTLTDCVSPEGRCFAEGQERTASAVQELVNRNDFNSTKTRRVVVLAAVCAEEPEVRSEENYIERIRLMEKCVNDQLDRESDAQQGTEP